MTEPLQIYEISSTGQYTKNFSWLLDLDSKEVGPRPLVLFLWLIAQKFR